MKNIIMILLVVLACEVCKSTGTGGRFGQISWIRYDYKSKEKTICVDCFIEWFEIMLKNHKQEVLKRRQKNE